MKRRIWIVLGLFCLGCVTLTPEQKLSHELFVEAAGQCESRYHTVHVEQVDLDGNLKARADADSRAQYRDFVACYHEGLKARAEARRKAGLPVPEALTTEKDVDLD
jgi:hypothetical protein